ncbi:MAG: hypothetical protein DCC75_04670 [Proteobacteria bacterium]|nr:MAG: hypothetical protein DCC75_04670 [Pseudomonadota bacterium]
MERPQAALKPLLLYLQRKNLGHPLRDRNPDLYHLVTVRTLEAYIWIVPSDKLNKILGGILARYQEIYRVSIFAYCILGNHLHLVLKPTLPNLDEFMENVLREMARRVNRAIGRRGYFWSRRYDDQVILSEEDLLEAFLYVTTNPVKHGLVAEASSWPGLHCLHQILDEKPRQYPFVQFSKEDEFGKPMISYHTLSLTPLPQMSALNRNNRVRELRAMIAARQKELATARRNAGLGFLGAKAIRSQPRGSKPVTVSYSPRPICYSKDPEIKRQYRADRRFFCDAYIDASIRFRSGDLTAEFPSHCFKPPLHRTPKKICQ